MKRFFLSPSLSRSDYRYLTNGENHFQRRLSRSNSFELPMELKRQEQHFNLTSLPHIAPRMRYSLNQHITNRQRPNSDRSHRLSLNQASLINSQNHQVRMTP